MHPNRRPTSRRPSCRGTRRPAEFSKSATQPGYIDHIYRNTGDVFAAQSGRERFSAKWMEIVRPTDERLTTAKTVMDKRGAELNNKFAPVL
jgi:hypothetical protein